MSKFKIGDKVVRTGIDFNGIATVSGYSGGYSSGYFRLAPSIYPNPAHVNAEFIKAWADGAAVQFKSIHDGEWYDDHAPDWCRDTAYRIKPTKSDKDIKIEKLEAKLLEIHKELGELKGE